MNYKYYLEVITPLHIGNGARLKPLEYVVLPEKKKFYRLDMKKLFASPSFNVDGFVRGSKNRNFSIEKMIDGNIEEFAAYSLFISGVEARLLERNKGQVQEMVKESGTPYIPGSSLKGALRTSLLKSFLAEDSFCNEYEKEIQNASREATGLRGEKRDKIKKFFSSEAESKLLGTTNYCLMRALQISDSSMIGWGDVAVYVVKVASKTRDGYAWKILGRNGGVTDNSDQATPSFIEALIPGTRVEGTLKIDEFLLQDEIGGILGFKGKNFLADLVGCCRRACEGLLRNEALYYRNLGLHPLVLAYEQLLKFSKSLTPNQFFWQISWGTDYGAKGVGKAINSDIFEAVRETFRMGYRNQEFPKTRKIVFQNGRPLTVPGWVKVTLEGE